MTWVKAVAGRLESRFRYSNELCYNTFPIPDLNQKQRDNISTHALNVIQEREKYIEVPIGDLYGPSKMPKDLKSAHEQLDQIVESCYRSKPFVSDEQRLEHLFKLYNEKNNNMEKK